MSAGPATSDGYGMKLPPMIGSSSDMIALKSR
jgi:hypothetical protein